jgi:hypothetical protein
MAKPGEFLVWGSHKEYGDVVQHRVSSLEEASMWGQLEPGSWITDHKYNKLESLDLGMSDSEVKAALRERKFTKMEKSYRGGQEDPDADDDEGSVTAHSKGRRLKAMVARSIKEGRRGGRYYEGRSGQRVYVKE